MKWYILAVIGLTAFIVSACQTQEEAIMEDRQREMERIENGRL